jgi:hypothetical protein
MKNSVVVKASGSQLDKLRGEASRIARDRNADWSCEAAEKGLKFWFENKESTAAFASFCEDSGLSFVDS